MPYRIGDNLQLLDRAEVEARGRRDRDLTRGCGQYN